MKKIVLTLIIALGIASIFSGCDRPDYQHPMHRSK
jgi:hypothetical protein